MPEQEQNAQLRRQVQEQSTEIAALKVLCCMHGQSLLWWLLQHHS